MKAALSLTRLLLVICAFLASAMFVRAAEKAQRIAVIPKGTSHEFWKSIHAGAIKAQRELEADGKKVEIIWKGPVREDDREQQIQVVENFMSGRADAIVLAPLDSQALVKPVEAATRAKIPVVIIDSGIKTKNIASYVATDNYKGGQLGGEQLAKLLNGKGRVILLRYQVGSASTEEREAGFLDAIKKHPQIELISTNQYGGPTRESAYQASQNLFNRFGRQVDGIFCSCEPITTGVTLALKDIGRLGGAVKIVGFDAGTQSVASLDRGDVQALVLQDPIKMGYLGVRTAVAALGGKKVEPLIDTGVTIVTRENMKTPAMQELLNPPLAQYLGGK